MRSKLPFLALAASLALFSCKSPGKEYVLKVKLQKLTEDNIYDKDIVYDVIFDAEEMNLDSLQTKSRQLFLQGVDLYKNKHNPKGAISLFRQSILTFPEAKAYYELGNALLDARTGTRACAEATRAYEVAEHLGFSPRSSVAYRMACANYMIYRSNPKDSSSYLYYTLSALRSAFNSGYRDTAAIAKDPDIKGIVAVDDYRSMLIDMRAEWLNSPGANSLFTLYGNAFPANTTEHFEIGKEQVDMHDYKTSISYEFASFIPEMQNTSFSREVSHDYFYVTKLRETPQYTALIYSSVSFYGEDMQPVNTTLAIYDKEGNIISRKLVSCQCSAEKIKTVSILDNEIRIEDYKRIWDKPFTEVSFEENSVKSYEQLASAVYTIDDSGKIREKEVPKNYNDSTIVAAR